MKAADETFGATRRSFSVASTLNLGSLIDCFSTIPVSVEDRYGSRIVPSLILCFFISGVVGLTGVLHQETDASASGNGRSV